MKIGLTTYPTAFQNKGGLEVQIRQTERALRDFGVDVRIVDPYVQKLNEFDIIHQFSLGHSSLRILQKAKNWGIPCVTSPMADPLNSTFEIYKVRFICYVLPHLTGQGFRTRWHDMIDGLLLSDAICTITNREKQVIERLVPSIRGKVYVTPNGVTQEFFAADPAHFEALHPDLGPFVLVASSVLPHKNQLPVIEAAKSLGYRVVLIGSILDQHYYDLCIAAGGNMVTYLGEYDYPSESLTSLFAAASVVVLASTFEPFGLVPFEALAAGTPAILTKASGYDRLPDPPYFQRVNPHSAVDIKKALRVAWDTPRDRRVCRDSVVDLQWSVVARTLVGVYESILDAKRS